MSKKKAKKTVKKKKNRQFWRNIATIIPVHYWAWMGRRVLVLLLIGVVVGSVAFGFGFLDRYVHTITQQRELKLDVVLKNPPAWASQQLIKGVCLSTGILSDDFLLDESLSDKWAQNLTQNPWVKRLNLVRKRYDGRLEIDCQLRHPLASIRDGQDIYYVDAEGIVLPALPLVGAEGHVVRLQGVKVGSLQVGTAVNTSDLLAGIQLLAMLRQVDQQMPMPDRLWGELAVIDVSNFQGRLSQAESHLVLYTDNNTEIRWGAAVGQGRAWYEAPAKTKISNLYQSYKLYGNLGEYEYVDLRNIRKDKADPLRHRG